MSKTVSVDTDSITLITFASVKPSAGGASATAYSLAEKLYAENRLHKVICFSYDAKACKIPDAFFHVPPFRLFYRICWKLISGITKIFPIRERRIREEIFDFFVSRSKTIRNSSQILFAKPLFPKTVKRAKELKIRTCGLTTILHPKFNFERVRREQVRFNLPNRTNYTDSKRVSNISSFLNLLDHVLAISELSREILLKNGIPGGKISIVSNSIGVDTDRFKPASGKRNNKTFYVLHVSHMNLIKGVSYLLEAWNQLNLRNAELILGGNMDEDIHYISHRIKPSNVRLLGHLKDPTEVYHNADVFVMPSLSDASPAVIPEAMASGLPVIVSDGCGPSSIISHGVDGFVYQYDDTEKLKEHILWCYNHRDQLGAIGTQARKKIMSYRRKDFATQVLKEILR